MGEDNNGMKPAPQDEEFSYCPFCAFPWQEAKCGLKQTCSTEHGGCGVSFTVRKQ